MVTPSSLSSGRCPLAWRRRFLDYKETVSPFHGATMKAMPQYMKLILACMICLAVIAGLVLLVRHFF